MEALFILHPLIADYLTPNETILFLSTCHLFAQARQPAFAKSQIYIPADTPLAAIEQGLARISAFVERIIIRSRSHATTFPWTQVLKVFPSLKAISSELHFEFNQIESAASTIEELYLMQPGSAFLTQLTKLTKLKRLQWGRFFPREYIPSICDIPWSEFQALSSLFYAGRHLNVIELSQVKTLRELSLTNSKARMKWNAFGECRQITKLFITNEFLKDISFVSRLHNLESLVLMHCPISDIHPVHTLKKLRIIDLTGSLVDDVSPLAHCPNLTCVTLSHTLVTDISPLEFCTRLRDIRFRRSGVETLKSLGALIGINTLHVGTKAAADEVSEVTVKFSSTLGDLNISGILFKDFSFLSRLHKLSALDLSDTGIHSESLSHLKATYSLAFLNLSRTEVDDLSAIAHLSKLRDLNVESTKVLDLRPLSKLTLQTLNIANTSVSDLSPLSSMQTLQSLYAAYSRISDVTPLSRLPQLHVLHIKSTLVTSLEPLYRSGIKSVHVMRLL